MEEVTTEEKIVDALEAWKEESDERFNWSGPKPKPVIGLPLSSVLIARKGERAYVDVEAIIAAFAR
jgi:hypothetical protein